MGTISANLLYIGRQICRNISVTGVSLVVGGHVHYVEASILMFAPCETHPVSSEVNDSLPYAAFGQQLTLKMSHQQLFIVPLSLASPEILAL